MFEIRRAQGADHPAIRHLLALTPVGEPTHPLREEDVLYVAETDGTLIGISGLAPCAPHLGLFHSLLVRPGYRKRHIARQLYQRVMDHAYDLGIRELYTLTASGRTYFETLGFLPAPQDPPPLPCNACCMTPAMNRARPPCWCAPWPARGMAPRPVRPRAGMRTPGWPPLAISTRAITAPKVCSWP